jgi:branched-subunit amino acid ABC-type transport system permease component
MKLVNFAHGQLLMIGAYLTWTLTVTFGLNAYLAIVFTMPIVAVWVLRLSG